MNKTQRILLAIFLPFTVFSHFFTVLFQDTDPVLYFKFGLRSIMLLTVILLFKRTREHLLLILAFASSVFSDFFFVLAKSFVVEIPNRELMGMLGFIVGYLLLIAAFSRNVRFGKAELLTLLPFAATFLFVFLQLRQYAKGIMFPAAIVLGFVLCYFGMTMVATLYRGYYARPVAWFIALAGIIAFISDMVVAYSIFHPQFMGYIEWKDNFIWGTYMPAWTFLLVAAAANSLQAAEPSRETKPLLREPLLQRHGR